MIPVKLELRNFLAFRDPDPLDFSGLHLACLVGANGAGKSSLLDAMTWALWGKARARRDDDLIHGDEIEMNVIFTFDVGDNRYRASRYRSRQGRGRSELMLEVQNGSEWRALTEGTIRQTQEKIDRLLRIDYETFVNSAYLVQGRADEFTRKTAAERKNILGEILGLSVWSDYEQRARDQINAIKNELALSETRLQEYEGELGRESQYQRELADAYMNLNTLNEQLTVIEERYHELEAANRRRSDQRRSAEETRFRLQQDERELSAIAAEQARHTRRIEEFQAVVAARSEIEQGYAALLEARAAERDFSDRLMTQSGLSQQREALERAVLEARAELEAQCRGLRERIATLQRTTGQAIDPAEIESRQADVARLEELEEQYNVWTQQVSDMKSQVASLNTEKLRLRDEMAHIKEQQEQIRAAQDPVCPLCGQELSATHRAELLEHLQSEGTEKGARYRANQDVLKEWAAEVAGLEGDIEEARIELRGLPPLREHIARLLERTERAASAAQELAEADETLAALEQQLETGSYAVEQQAELAVVREQLAALGYDESAHRAAQQDIRDHESFEGRKSLLDRALEDLPEVETALTELAQRAAGWEERIATTRARLTALEEEIASLDAMLADYQAVAAERDRLHEARNNANFRVGMAQQRLDALKQIAEQRIQTIEAQKTLRAEQAIYEELRLAFSRDGVPAMVIEAAIPEIENEANQLLARMTGGRMHIRFDTQREKVTGGVMETLDIKIADELGTRDYNTFSGGETFRVNFAIRLALSRLLARRAGTQLRSLIIDEGFGTQDEAGRSRLIEAINAIQDEFDLILVITHIEELKDAFPARIEVTKTRDGSVIELV